MVKPIGCIFRSAPELHGRLLTLLKPKLADNLVAALESAFGLPPGNGLRHARGGAVATTPNCVPFPPFDSRRTPGP